MVKWGSSLSAEILVVVDEVGQLPLPVDSLACRTHRVGERTRTATEDTNFADVAMLLLDKLEEGRHVGPAKVVDGLEAREHAALR